MSEHYNDPNDYPVQYRIQEHLLLYLQSTPRKQLTL